MEYIPELKDSFNVKRKLEHLQIALNEQTMFDNISNGLENYHFIHQALPEINLTDVKLSIDLFHKHLAAPLIISPMTGGTPEAKHINRNLAYAAQNLGLAMGVGSQRCLIESPTLADTYQVRDIAPDILLFANLGAIQLNNGYTVTECRKAVEIIEADALILHLNPLQEALQPEGNTNFAGLYDKIAAVCGELSVPVVVKEIGYGISKEVALKLIQSGVSGIDVAGAGGTCWSEIEKMRRTNESSRLIASAFSSWGIPTADSLIMTRNVSSELTVIASGGIRSGLDIAKVIALGADAAGIASPLLKAADKSADAVEEYLKVLIEELRIVMYCIATESILKLKSSQFIKKVS